MPARPIWWPAWRLTIDVAVAIDHPTQDNWVTVGGDVVAVALGYAVGKVVVGPLLGALARRFGPAAGEAVAAETAAETAAAKAEADRIAAYKAKQNSPEAQAQKAAAEARKAKGAEKARLKAQQKAEADAARRQVPVEPSRTKPSRTPNPEARPSGSRTKIKGDKETQQSLRRENEAADHAAKAGYDIEQNPTVPGSKNPDYRLEGKVFDGYSPQGDNLNTIRETMTKKVTSGQTRRLLLNLDDAPTISAENIATLSQQVKASAPELEEVLVWKNGQFHHVYP